MPELTEAEALRFIAMLAGGLWLIMFAGFGVVHIRANRKRD